MASGNSAEALQDQDRDRGRKYANRPNIVFHGDFVEFLADKRCQICQEKDHKCIVSPDVDRCIPCSGSNSPCIFERTLKFRASMKDLPWSCLLDAEGAIEIGPTR